jgi:SWI/SNF-related matrix-associated actin-dependent regulator 1 of chromatin subfamily A
VFGYNATGSSNLEELDILLRKTVMIRRIKSDVYSELGEKTRYLVTLENFDVPEEYLSEMNHFNSQFNSSSMKKNNEMLLLNWYQETAKVKAAPCLVYIENFLKKNKDEKVLIFAHHVYMINSICSLIENLGVPYIKIDGSTKADSRSELVNIFQNEWKIRVAVLSIRSCNAGITLTAASNVIFAEFDWNPSTIIQAESRLHRIGQQREVKVFFLYAPKTADETIFPLLLSKQENLGKAGLVAQVENFAKHLIKEKFNVQEMKEILDCLDESNCFEDSEAYHTCQLELESFSSDINRSVVANSFTTAKTVVNYFDDDDDEEIDEEILQELEKLPH